MYTLRAADVGSLNDLTARIKSLLPADPGWGDPQTYANLLGIALPRYRESLLHVGPVESRITSAITCLEALFLTGSEQGEMSYRLALRTALVLRLFGFQPADVFEEIKHAYSIRSKYVHGVLIDAKSRRELEVEAPQLARSIAEYTRVCLLVFLQTNLVSSRLKEAFLGQVDAALVDPAKESSLKTSILGRVAVTR